MIWLLDNCLKDTAGHYFGYAKCLYQCAEANDIPMRVLGHKEVCSSLTKTMSIEPVFRFNAHEPRHSWLWSHGHRATLIYDYLRSNFDFYNDLKRALRGRVKSDDTLLMTMANHRQVLAWAKWIEKWPAGSSPRVVLIFRLNYYDIADENWNLYQRVLARHSFRVLEAASKGRNIQIGTDSSRLVDELARLTQLPVTLLPIPHTNIVSLATDLPTGDYNEGVHFITLGDAREEKGFALVVEAIEKLYASNQLQGIRFTLHSYISGECHAKMLNYRNRLADLKLANVEFITVPLATDEYHRLLLSADVVLLPYDRRTYYARTSGPLAESLAAGKPVIVTHDTWMSEQLKSYGKGWTFVDDSADDLARTIISVAKSFSSSAESHILCPQHEWINIHNPQKFISQLMRL